MLLTESYRLSKLIVLVHGIAFNALMVIVVQADSFTVVIFPFVLSSVLEGVGNGSVILEKTISWTRTTQSAYHVDGATRTMSQTLQR